MRASVRRLGRGGFGAATILVLMGSFAQAQAHDSQNPANLWFCHTASPNCSYALGRVGQPVTAGANKQAYATASYYSSYGDATSGAASASATFTLHWTTGDHVTDDACFVPTTSANFKQTNGTDATFQTTTTGVWSQKGPVSMPHAGTYTICASPTAANSNASVSQSFYPFIVL